MSLDWCKIGAVHEEVTFAAVGGTVYAGRAHAKELGPIG
jgi:hypothetical protein